MPRDPEDKRASRKARKMLEEGKAPTTAAGPFIDMELDHVKKGKHGARSKRQAVAIGISKARRHGVPYHRKGTPTRRQSAGRGKKSQKES